MNAPKVDVLAVMAIDAIDAAKERQWNWDAQERARDSHMAITAVTDLIDRAKALSDSISFRIDDPRCELHCKLIDALASVRGAA